MTFIKRRGDSLVWSFKGLQAYRRHHRRVLAAEKAQKQRIRRLAEDEDDVQELLQRVLEDPRGDDVLKKFETRRFSASRIWDLYLRCGSDLDQFIQQTLVLAPR
jgi:hypothetical protein